MASERDPVERVEELLANTSTCNSEHEYEQYREMKDGVLSLVRDLARERAALAERLEGYLSQRDKCLDNARESMEAYRKERDEECDNLRALLREIARSEVHWKGATMVVAYMDRETWDELQEVAGREG